MISSSLLKEPAQEGVIDLTKDDYVPMSKKLAFAFERESGILPGTSVKCIQLHCFSCIAMVNETEIIELPKCRHTFCYSCFIKAVHICKDIIISCPLSQCKEDISDKVLKIVLKTEDYILYLEKHCDVIKKNLKILQRNFAGYYDSPEQANEICSQQSEWQHLQNLETRDFIKNNHPFDCSICFSFVPIDKGVTLKNCLHSFCKECIAETIKHSNEQLVICPYASAEGSCEFHIQDREIRALVTPAVYEKHLSKGLKHAECNLPSFHCKTPDCGGWIELAGGVDAFECEVCRKVNCIKCQDIHEDKTCQQHQDDLKLNEKNKRETKMTEEAVKEMIARNLAMLCPQCEAVVEKMSGCDFLLCLNCKLGICWVTKKPRQPITKMLNGKTVVIDGCHCLETKNQKCHLKCGNCH